MPCDKPANLKFRLCGVELEDCDGRKIAVFVFFRRFPSNGFMEYKFLKLLSNRANTTFIPGQSCLLMVSADGGRLYGPSSCMLHGFPFFSSQRHPSPAMGGFSQDFFRIFSANLFLNHCKN
jgi:hypothetical protein